MSAAELVVLVAAATALGAAGLFVLALRAPRAHGSSRRALLTAILLALPPLLLLALSELTVGRGNGSLAKLIELRRAIGLSGTILALPAGLSFGAWSGLAATRRVCQAAERARLAAAAVGYAEIGREVGDSLAARALFSRGLLAGLLSSVAILAPSLALLHAASGQLEGLELLEGLGPTQRRILGVLQAREAGEMLLQGVRIGAVATVATAGVLGLLVHAGSSRRRNLLRAVRILERRGAPQTARVAVFHALAASGRPGPLLPAAVAAALLALAIWAYLARAHVPPRYEEAVASGAAIIHRVS